jgi:type II secretory pathway pseudopilin PulG
LAAVLVAIAIPVFTSQLEKSREATDISNIRSAYAEAMAEYLSSGADDAYYSEVSLKQQLDGWRNKENNTLYTRINGEEKPVTIDDRIVGKDKTVYVNVAADGTVTVTATAVGTKVGASSSTTPDP